LRSTTSNFSSAPLSRKPLVISTQSGSMTSTSSVLAPWIVVSGRMSATMPPISALSTPGCLRRIAL
jgi:hypothetical protein